MVLEEWGGQSGVSSDIQNWIGTRSISGADLADSLKKHVMQYAGEYLTIMSPIRATGLTPKETSVEITLSNGSPVEASTALITTGANRRALEVPGAKEYDQKGLTYCASCDGPLFADKDVAIIGGGNAAFETALQLLAYCNTVTLFNRGDTFKADEISVAAALANPKMRVVKNSEILEVVGEKFVTGLRWKDLKTNAEALLPVEGIFVEIGLIPNTAWVGNALVKNQIGQIIADPRTHRAFYPSSASGPDARRGERGDGDVLKGTATETLGPRNDAGGLLAESRVWAAGDCTDGLYHQNNIAAGDAVKALEDIYMALRTKEQGI